MSANKALERQVKMAENAQAFVADVVDKMSCISEKDMPWGQRLLRNGFKPITVKDLRAAFCCDQITEQEKEAARQRLLRRLPKHAKVSDVYSGGFWRRVCVAPWSKGDHERYKICVLAEKPLESYMDQLIPDRCLQSVARAKKLGITDFQVMYPEMQDVPLPRFTAPIIIGKVSKDTWAEIDRWE